MTQGRRLLSAAIMGSLIFAGPSPLAWVDARAQGSGAPVDTQTSKSAGDQSTRPQRHPKALVGLEVIADLTVTPATYNGQCPSTFVFKGKIGVNRATTVHYRFVRSDNVRSKPVVLVFDKPGIKEVTTTWQFDPPPGSADFTGWQAIQINYPMGAQSNPAYFRGTCTNHEGKAAAPSSAPK